MRKFLFFAIAGICFLPITALSQVVKLKSFEHFPICVDMRQDSVLDKLGKPDSTTSYLYQTTGDSVSLLFYKEWKLLLVNKNVCRIEYSGNFYKTTEGIFVGNSITILKEKYGPGNTLMNGNIGYNSDNEYKIEFSFFKGVINKIIITCHYV